MKVPEENDLEFLDRDNLEAVENLLSKESYDNLQKELKRRRESAPSFSGLGIDHPGYIPTTLEEYKTKVTKLQERLAHISTLCFFYEILEREARRENKHLVTENKNLKEENKTLRDEIKRAYNQIQSTLGLKPSKPKEQTAPNNKKKRKKRGAPKGHIGKSRPIPRKVDKVHILSPPSICPCCSSTEIIPTNTYISKYIEDIAPIVKQTTENRYIKGSCVNCKSAVIASAATTGPPVSIGNNVKSIVTVMREQMGVSLRKLSQFVSETLQISLSQSGVLGVLNKVSRKMEPIYKGIEISLRSQSVLHGDETGWRMDGERWYLWCFCNKEIVYFHPDPSRGTKVPKAIIGDDFPGIFHSDFYGSYNFIGNKQRCLVHFMRDINEELEIKPKDEPLRKLKNTMKKIIEKGNIIKTIKETEEKAIQFAKLENKLNNLTRIKTENKRTNTLIQRIVKHKQDMLRFALNDDVEYHNNRAERTIRSAVIFRKISFGNRTSQGAQNYAIISSVLETCKLKGNKLVDFLQNVLVTPDNQLHKITKSLLDTS